MLLRLGYVGIEIENCYHSPRDIEWGVHNNDLYLLQSRPMTNYAKETMHEIDHEFDDALRVENEFFIAANVGEIMPAALSPLGLDIIRKSFIIHYNLADDPGCVNESEKSDYLKQRPFHFMSSHLLFNFAEAVKIRNDEEISMMMKGHLVSIFGRVPEEEEMFEVSRIRWKQTLQGNISYFKEIYSTLRILISASKKLKEMSEFILDYEALEKKDTTSEKIFKRILLETSYFSGLRKADASNAMKSSVLNTIVLSILRTAHGNFDEVVYSEFSKLVKTFSDVESADIPKTLQKIAFYIAEEINSKEFKSMSIENALKWLKASNSRSGEMFRKFIENHGHRGFQEYDIYSHPWREKPDFLIKSLQSMVGNVSKEMITEKEQENLNDLLSTIAIPLGFTSRLILRWVVPLCRSAVQNREITKSLLMKFMDIRRKDIRRLAELMIQEGRIPDEDLLFFMTLDEINELLEKRSPNVINKALQRKRRFPVVYEYRFPEIMKGLPKPINRDSEETITNDINFSMKGIPVSQGVVKGFARVALTLEEAESIKPGEILITYSTDIGWTPYFPQLAGVITELGGLISHGAVVSREYGIPCVCGLHGATKQFQSGDFVFLDGSQGILQKLPFPDQ